MIRATAPERQLYQQRAVPRMSGDDPLSDRMPTMVDAAAIAFNQKRW
jgi:hypothetical protein